MISFPHCKINLGLRITAKREDHYHDLDTVFYPVAINDALEFVVADEMKFMSSGISIPGKGKNLVVAAYDFIKADHPDLPPIHIHLHKQIPIGAGLGGGSSNAAAMLKMLNTFFDLKISHEKLHHYASQLGSDCPFFLYDSACKASGRGEILKLIQLDLAAYRMVLVYPNLHISTADAFSEIKPCQVQRSCAEIVNLPITEWRELLINDFEESIFNRHSILADIKQKLYDQGALYAAMSGSGSTIFGIFGKDDRPTKEALMQDKLLGDMQLFLV
ncbi:MAG: 4-(cytidine 5'-diphospho)-2-C-methyl-D-erythritol kinase [Bacteroidetes bacterium]|nr:4-(cytidine 5'-diphospho)-2-C-methyl-D-erythritol kinase [Bacteroidota bacterium]